MLRAYGLLLRLYPKTHRETFGLEMKDVFRQAAEEERSHGGYAYLRFLAREAAGLLLGSGSQWARTLQSEAEAEPECDREVPPEIGALRLHIALNVRRMEYAIAHHQFPQARLYSEIDRQHRARLEQWWREQRGEL